MNTITAESVALANGRPPVFMEPSAFAEFDAIARRQPQRAISQPQQPVFQPHPQQEWYWECANIVEPTRHVYTSAMGLGDTISTLYAVCGLASTLKLPIVYHARSAEWLSRCRHPNLYIEPIERAERGVNVEHGLQGYCKACAEAESRCKSYCENLSGDFDVPPFEAIMPSRIDRTIYGNVPSCDYAMISPYSCFAAREWPSNRWRSLCEHLIPRGLKPYVLVGENQIQRAATDFEGMDAVIYAGQPADSVIDMLLGSKLLIGNDSGIVHVGGLHGVPTISIHSGSLPHSFLYDVPTSITSVCDNGLKRSDHNPKALYGISVKMVVDAIGNILA